MIYAIRSVTGICILCATIFSSAYAQAESTIHSSPHCYANMYERDDSYRGINPFPDIKDLAGPVKAVHIKRNDTEETFVVDKSRRIVKETSKRNGEKVFDNSVFNYDENGRLSFINSDKVGGTETRFIYPSNGEVIEIAKWFYEGERWRIAKSQLSTAPDGTAICVYASLSKGQSIKDSNYLSYILIHGKNGYIRSTLTYTDIPNYDQPVFDFQKGMELITAHVVESYIFRSEIIKRCGGRLPCYFQEEGMDNGVVNVDAGTMEANGQSINHRFWKDKNGNAIEYIVADDQKLSNGDLPHHRIAYQYDSHGNWIKKEVFVQKDSGQGIKYIKGAIYDNVSRIIEYYSN